MDIFNRLMACIFFLILLIKVVEPNSIHYNCSNPSDTNLKEFNGNYFKYLLIEDCQYFEWSRNVYNFFNRGFYKVIFRNVNFTNSTDLDFSVFSKVQELTIENTNIQTIPRGLKDLTHLYIFNNIIAFNFTNFNKMAWLEEVYIKNTEFESSELNFKNLPIKILRFNYIKNLQLQNYSFAYIKTLLSIALKGCNLVSIPETIFRGAENLERIYLNDNKIKTLSNHSFCNLTKSHTLHLQNNSLEILSNGTFNSLKNLIFLNLGNIFLTILPDKTFDSLEKLNELYLENNLLKSLPSGIFNSLKKLSVLNLGNNSLTILPNRTFDFLEHLKQLHLENNLLKSLPSGIFHSLQKLEILDLKNNSLAILPSGIFHSLQKLKILDLKNNSLAILPSGIFNSLKNLEILNLKNNCLTVLPYGTFNYLINLKRLDLGNNFLNFQYSPEEYIFSNLNQLDYLNLEHNLINNSNSKFSFLHEFHYLFNINEINFSNNQNFDIDICYVFYYLPLKTLNLKNTSLTYLFDNTDDKYDDDDYKYNKKCNLRICRDIDLSYTKINVIIFQQLSTMGCQFYNFSNNYIEIIDTDFKPNHNKNMQLDMDNTTILCNWKNFDFIISVPNINKTFKILNYETIRCSNNEIMVNWTKNKENIYYPMSSVMEEGYNCSNKCKCFWYPIIYSFKVDCSNRKLEEIPRFLAPNYIPKRGKKIKVKYVKVDLQNNNLVRGPSQQDGYDNVTVLILSGNKIGNISWIPPKIQDLYLDHNDISFLNEQIIDSLRGSSLKSIKLGENPFICDCTTVKLKQFLVGNSQVVDKQNVKCDGTNIQIIYADNICQFPWVIIIVLVLFLFIISSFLASYYKWKKYIKMWLYYKGWLLWFVTEEELDKDKVYDVFLSFSQKDDDFVLRTLLPELESGPNPYKVCVHYRDWIPGVLITEQVITSVRDSRRTLVIVSKNFLESCWTKMEFRTAYTQALTEGRTRVIVLVYGEVDMTQIDGDLSVYMKMTTYINWEDPWFWKKMLYALPHKNRNNQIRTTTV